MAALAAEVERLERSKAAPGPAIVSGRLSNEEAAPSLVALSNAKIAR